jgi:hypothetical protein
MQPTFSDAIAVVRFTRYAGIEVVNPAAVVSTAN